MAEGILRAGQHCKCLLRSCKHSSREGRTVADESRWPSERTHGPSGPEVPPPSPKSTGVERLWNMTPEGIFLHPALIQNADKYATANTTSVTAHVLTCTKEESWVFPTFYITHPIFLHVCVLPQNSQWQGAHTKPFFFSTSDNAPPSLARCQAFLSLS